MAEPAGGEDAMKILLLSVVLGLAACGGDSRDDSVGKEIADDYQEVLDEAAAVEGQVEASKERVDAALEEADGKDAP
jgi:hypothetical protein